MDDSESIWEHSSANYNSPNKQIRGKIVILDIAPEFLKKFWSQTR